MFTVNVDHLQVLGSFSGEWSPLTEQQSLEVQAPGSPVSTLKESNNEI